MKSRYTFWMDCPTHGTKEYPSASNFTDKQAYCSDCKGFTGTSRVIKVTRNHMLAKLDSYLLNGDNSYELTRCDNRCLKGKFSCDCVCRGACHGQGTCNPELH
jgi:hypothetical protein